MRGRTSRGKDVRAVAEAGQCLRREVEPDCARQLILPENLLIQQGEGAGPLTTGSVLMPQDRTAVQLGIERNGLCNARNCGRGRIAQDSG